MFFLNKVIVACSCMIDMRAGSADGSTKESNLELLDFSPEGASALGIDSDKFSGRNSIIPYRRILIPATSKFPILLNAFGSEIDSCLSKREDENSLFDGYGAATREHMNNVGACVALLQMCAPTKTLAFPRALMVLLAFHAISCR